MVDDQKICNGQHLTESIKNESVAASVEEEEGMGERDKMLLEQLRDDLQSRLRSKLREKIIQKMPKSQMISVIKQKYHRRWR